MLSKGLNQLYDSILRTVLWGQPESVISCSSVSLSGLLLSWPENIWFLGKTRKPPASTVRRGPFLKLCLDGEKLYVKGSRHDRGLLELHFITVSQFGLVWFFFLLKSSQAAPLSAHPWPHITRLALWPNNPPRIPPLAGPTLVSLKTLHHVQHRTPHFYFSLSPKLCPWSCPHCPIAGSPGPPRSELWSPGKRFMAEVDGSKWWQGCGLFLKMKSVSPSVMSRSLWPHGL